MGHAAGFWFDIEPAVAIAGPALIMAALSALYILLFDRQFFVRRRPPR
jgi:hypothetical protein